MRSWGLLLGWALVSCGGMTDDPRAETADGVAPGQGEDESSTAPDRCEGVKEAVAVGGQPSVREPVEDEPVEDEQPASGGADNAGDPAPGDEGAAGEPGAVAEPEHGCSDVCATLAECAGQALSECSERCEQSAWVETHELRCLALRVYWIDEEGCGVMLETYEQFEPDDDCSN